LELTDKFLLVGRAPDNLLQIEDQNISKHHALLIRADDTYLLFDLHSANGTYVNDERISSTKLKDGDVLRFGPGTFRFESRPVARKIGLKAAPKPGPTLSAPPAKPVPLPPPEIPAPPAVAPPAPQPLKAIPRKPTGEPAPLPTAPPAPVPKAVVPTAPAAGLGARPALRKSVAPAPAVSTPPPVVFPEETDSRETAAAAVVAPPPAEPAPGSAPEPATPPPPQPGDEIPRERTLRFRPAGGGGEVRLRLKK
jgi:predicted component of type VI protein secretion system